MWEPMNPAPPVRKQFLSWCFLPDPVVYCGVWRTTAENRYTPVPSYNGAVRGWVIPLYYVHRHSGLAQHLTAPLYDGTGVYRVSAVVRQTPQ